MHEYRVIIFRCLQERNAVQGNIPALADQQLSQQAAGNVLSSLLESAETEVFADAEYRRSRPEGETLEVQTTKSNLRTIQLLDTCRIACRIFL